MNLRHFVVMAIRSPLWRCSAAPHVSQREKVKPPQLVGCHAVRFEGGNLAQTPRVMSWAETRPNVSVYQPANECGREWNGGKSELRHVQSGAKCEARGVIETGWVAKTPDRPKLSDAGWRSQGPNLEPSRLPACVRWSALLGESVGVDHFRCFGLHFNRFGCGIETRDFTQDLHGDSTSDKPSNRLDLALAQSDATSNPHANEFAVSRVKSSDSYS